MLTHTQLPPAHRTTELPDRVGERGAGREPVDPGDTESRETTRGRRPEDVVQSRETREPYRGPEDRSQEDRAEGEGEGEQRQPAKAEPQKWVIRGTEYTFQELIKRPDLINDLATTAQQFPIVQKKYQALLEREAGKPAPAPAEPEKKLTPEQLEALHQQGTLKVLAAYEPIAEKEVAFLVASGKMEPDFADAYPLAVKTVAAILRYHLDAIQQEDHRVNACVDWIKAEADFRDALVTKSILDKAIDQVAEKASGKDGKFYEPLAKDAKRREEFKAWIEVAINPEVKNITAESIDAMWFAFNKPAVQEALKGTNGRQGRTSTAARAGGDGHGSRNAVPEAEPNLSPSDSLRERLTATRLGPAE
jgi:hypothetical protein